MGRQVRGRRKKEVGEIAQRLCLVCGNMFKSRHKYNRVCDTCEFKDTVILYKVTYAPQKQSAGSD